jgi:hypothetical protein
MWNVAAQDRVGLNDDEVFSERHCRVTMNLHSPSSSRVHDDVRHVQLWRAARFFDEPFVPGSFCR